MSAYERLRAHLIREARKRVLEELNGARVRPADLAEKLRAAERCVTDELVQLTAQSLRKSAELCEHIVATYGSEYPPELVREIAERGKWKRELADELKI